jgi:hypothetical protein
MENRTLPPGRSGRPSWVVLAALLAAMLLPSNGFPGMTLEAEPNNTMENATPTGGEDLILGTLDDEVDYYLVLLPSTGEYTLLLSGFPRDADVVVEVFGFGDQIRATRGVSDSAGEQTITIGFTVRDRMGFVRVGTTLSGTVCEEGWCLARFSEQGCYYVIRSGEGVPLLADGVPVLGKAGYAMTFRRN